VSDLSTLDVKISPKEKFREFLATKGLRFTQERATVVEAVFATHEHFDAEQWVADLSAREDGDRVSRSTIYRTLNLLEEAGMIRKVARAKDREVYEHDYGYPQHDHLICKKCGELIEFENDAIAQAVDNIAARHGFRLEGHRLEVYGICDDCSRPPQRRHRKLDLL